MKIERVWAMPNKRTFDIPPIRKLLDEELGRDFVDPFPYPFKHDAIKYLNTFEAQSVDNLMFDPPYSQRQLREVYDNAGLSLEIMNNSYWSKCKDGIARIIKPCGKVISFGWNSSGIGKNRGFEITRVLLVCHGSQHNDTICIVEKKVQTTLDK